MRPLLVLCILALAACPDEPPDPPGNDGGPDVGVDASQPDPEPFSSIAYPASAERFARFEVSFALTKQYENPYDPRQVDVRASFKGPDGATTILPAFYFQDFERGPDAALTPRGDAGWKVRFAPHLAGEWTFTLVLAEPGAANIQSLPRTFNVVPSTSHGFLRQSSTVPNYLVFDDGAPYFGVGENIAWGDIPTYEHHLAALGAAGGNFARIWLSEITGGLGVPGVGGMDLEWVHGVGRYDQKAAFQIDKVLEAGERNGVSLMLCIYDHGRFSLWVNPEYTRSPYRASRGGPLPDDDPSAVWTNLEAKAAMQRLFRYLIARYGYSTAVHSWELWNEMEWVGAKYGDFAAHQAEAAAWHAEMATYIREHDPFGHLVTTSLAHALDFTGPLFDAMDFAQSHLYASLQPPTDMALAATMEGARVEARFGKPTLIGEYGVIPPEAHTRAQYLDALRRGTHEVLWSSLMARAMSSTVVWPWDAIDPDLYPVFTGVAAFTAGERLAELDPVAVKPEAWSPAQGLLLLDDSAIPRFSGFDAPAPATAFALDGEGLLTPDETSLKGFLMGTGRPALRQPVTFQVSYRAAGSFAVVVKSASTYGTPRLTIKLDGAATPVQDTQVASGATVSVAVPLGDHAITVDCTGEDWVEVERYVFSRPQPGLRARALQGPGRALGWVQNRAGTLTWDRLGQVPTAVTDGAVALSGVEDGTWAVEWWDPEAGLVKDTGTASASGGRLEMAAPSFTFDVAFKAMKQ